MRHVAGVLRSLGAVGLLLGFTFSCGNDTSSEPGDEETSSDSGGTAGSGGSGGTSAGGSGGANTTSGSTSTGAGGMNSVNTSASTTGNAAGAGNEPEPMPGLNEPCASDDDCEGDLICIAADSNALLVGGPANGLCTALCDMSNPCGADAGCIGFGEDSYCMLLCGLNDGVQDCAERDDAMCDVLGTDIACASDSDCPLGTLCAGDECLLPVCLPKCRVDSDCPEGRFCHAGYGECVDEEPEGSGLGELCDPEGGENECQGFCSGDAGTARCLETCGLGSYPACGSESEDNATAGCLRPYAGTDPGDLALCVGLCDCNSDCPDEGMVCVSFESIEDEFGATEFQGRAGYCELDDPELLDGTEVLPCESE